MRSFILSFIAVFVGVLTVSQTPALSQDTPPQSAMTATAYRALPDPGLIEVRPAMDISITERLVEIVSAALAGKSYQVVDRSDLVLSFETDLAWASGRAVPDGREPGQTAPNVRPDPQLRIPMPFARRQMPDNNFYSLRMTIFRQGQAPLWVGKATVTDRAQGRLQATERMIHGLIGVVGSTIERAPVPAAQ